uniref:OBG-type G domain-containing protein n=1 Tax=Ditylenchus dipsaci TaxID=166011 RepID=A0A915E5T4_9BILA
MRVMATAGLVGFPNAGKSTFLRAISRARPKVASYPFTTLNPHVGMVKYDDFQQLAVADIPGLVEGAHRNIGLGFNFLKHITRCSCILYFIDYTLKDYCMQLESLKREMDLYSSALSTKLDCALVVNKIDLVKDEAEIDVIRSMFPDQRVFFVSAREKIGLEEVLVYLREQYDKSVHELQRISAEQELNSLL